MYIPVSPCAALTHHGGQFQLDSLTSTSILTLASDLPTCKDYNTQAHIEDLPTQGMIDSGVISIESSEPETRVIQQKDDVSLSPGTPTVVALSEEDAKQIIDMLRADDMGARVAAAHRLDLVALTLGEQRTREELIPFLVDGFDDDDVVLSVIAVAIGSLVPHVGGIHYAYTLLPPLETLLAVEEPTVRDNAAQSTSSICKSSIQCASFHPQYIAMLNRLSAREWYTARGSASVLIATTFDLFTHDEQRNFISKYAILCKDEAPMVRRLAAKYLGTLITKYMSGIGLSCLQDGDDLLTTLIPLCEEFASNRQPDCVSLQIVQNCIALGEAISTILGIQVKDDSNANTNIQSEDGKKATLLICERVLPLVISLVDASSWRVRWTVASRYAELVSTFSTFTETLPQLIPTFEKLLSDVEPEVKTAAVVNLSKVVKHVYHFTLEDFDGKLNSLKLAKRVYSLAEDENETVRGALAMVVTDMAPILQKDDCITLLMPAILLLFKDISAEVRLNIISSLDPLNETIGVDLLSQSLYPSIVDLANDGKWRIRLAIMQHIPLLAKHFGQDYFTEKLLPLCIAWLSDSICRVREASSINLKELSQIFGAEWAIMFIIPELNKLRHHSSYLLRFTALQSFIHLAHSVDSTYIVNFILPPILEMAADDVPNIRFTVSKGLESLAQICGPTICASHFRPVLEILCTDYDKDVQYYSLKALKSLNKLEEMKESNER